MNEYPALNGLSREDAELFTDRYNGKKKSLTTAYILWFVGGPFGLHRFYMKDYFAGSVMLVLTIFTIGLLGIVGILDVLNIRRLVRHYNIKVANSLSYDIKKKYLKGVN